MDLQICDLSCVCVRVCVIIAFEPKCVTTYNEEAHNNVVFKYFTAKRHMRKNVM